MFDIGFWELILIAIMGLVVLGPDRLPVAIRTVSNWISSVRKLSDSVKSELTEELRLHELQSSLEKVPQNQVKKLAPEVEDSLKSLQEAADLINNPTTSIAPDETTKS